MAREIGKERSRVGELRAAYDTAFREWARERNLLQQRFRTCCNSLHLQDAIRLEDAARQRYQERRNLLAAYLMEVDSTSRPSHAYRVPQVERLARWFWERAGRPSGTADADWFRAERLVAYLGETFQTNLPPPPSVSIHSATVGTAGR